MSPQSRRRSFLDFSFGKAKYVLASDDVAPEIPIHRARLTRRAPQHPGEARNSRFILKLFVFTATREIPQAAKEQLGSCQKKAPNTLKSLDARLKSALVFRRRIASRGDARLAGGHDETAAVIRLFLGVAQVLFRRDAFPRRRQNHGSERAAFQRRRPPLRRRLAVQRAPLFGRAPSDREYAT